MTDATADLARLEAALRARRRLVVAFSGGVDSSCVLAAAVRALGGNVLAVTGDSPSLARSQLEQARRVARDLGARHVVLPTAELERPEYAANPSDRCFHCKRELYAVVRRRLGTAWPVLADGTNADDLGGHRPGLEAGRQAGVVSPLVETGLGKDAVRAVSRRLGLETADLPASPCLASRLPRGRAVTAERLARVERAEAALAALGFREFRVRWLGGDARVEIAAEELAFALTSGARESIVSAVQSAGFAKAVVDERPLRSGRLQEKDGA